MGEEEDLSSVEVFCPTSNEWSTLPSEMKEVNGWCTACLIEKPLRMMQEKRSVERNVEGLQWEEEIEEKNGKEWDWTTSDNARTEQRMKKMKQMRNGSQT